MTIRARVRSALAWPVRLLAAYDAMVSRMKPSLDGLVRGAAVSRFLATEREVTHNGVQLTLLCPNEVASYRAHTFSSKEPDTLDWLDGIGGVLWDIGANVGLYSIYFAKRSNSRVFAFEPSVFNLELLARNVHRNEVDVCIVPLALFSAAKTDYLNLSTTEHAGALSAFGVEYGGAGEKLDVRFRYPTLGMSVDGMTKLGVPAPDHIKIDIDGAEHEVLAGARQTLRSVTSVLVELNDRFPEQKTKAQALLKEAGLTLRIRSDEQAIAHNEIWVRA
ncbi:MAG: FkbM family methyltransferase [Steroidobacteraceae bacterium]